MAITNKALMKQIKIKTEGVIMSKKLVLNTPINYNDMATDLFNNGDIEYFRKGFEVKIESGRPHDLLVISDVENKGDSFCYSIVGYRNA